jgi:hypothetical protein
LTSVKACTHVAREGGERNKSLGGGDDNGTRRRKNGSCRRTRARSRKGGMSNTMLRVGKELEKSTRARIETQTPNPGEEGEGGLRRRRGTGRRQQRELVRTQPRGREEQQAATSPTAQGKETEPNVQLSLFLLQIVKIKNDNRIRTTAYSVLFSLQTWS